MRIHREMHLREDLFCRLSAFPFGPSKRRKRVRSLCVWCQTDRVKLLQEADEDEGHFVIRKLKSIGNTVNERKKKRARMNAYLLTKTNARTGIEWKEDKWLWCEILVQTIVEEAVRIKFFSCPGQTRSTTADRK